MYYMFEFCTVCPALFLYFRGSGFMNIYNQSPIVEKKNLKETVKLVLVTVTYC